MHHDALFELDVTRKEPEYAAVAALGGILYYTMKAALLQIADYIAAVVCCMSMSKAPFSSCRSCCCAGQAAAAAVWHNGCPHCMMRCMMDQRMKGI